MASSEFDENVRLERNISCGSHTADAYFEVADMVGDDYAEEKHEKRRIDENVRLERAISCGSHTADAAGKYEKRRIERQCSGNTRDKQRRRSSKQSMNDVIEDYMNVRNNLVSKTYVREREDQRRYIHTRLEQLSNLGLAYHQEPSYGTESGRALFKRSISDDYNIFKNITVRCNHSTTYNGQTTHFGQNNTGTRFSSTRRYVS